MNKMIKRIASAAAVVALVYTTGYAQSAGDSKSTRLGFGFNAGIPTTDGYNVSLGGDARLQQDFTSNVSGMLTVGYTNFSRDGENAGSVGYIPVKAGIKIFPVERFYFSGEVGPAFGTDDGQKTAIVWAPGIGLGFNNGVDLGLRYEGFSANGSTLGHVALRVAYGFALN
ncbi:hypothetical protein [Hufsiella ginkgonis]|uniref:Outer membrane beta-barrel protein n=1 Tax=Hufsiella ginkgonis TaxID=2695274 RepID=A0A7K1XX43_9SPHI|nr:hypothetical protein [Hufsiella ginkgonis]MXV15407.1 hypothetical protein [Hufsiella ginkgonis]